MITFDYNQNMVFKGYSVKAFSTTDILTHHRRASTCVNIDDDTAVLRCPIKL